MSLYAVLDDIELEIITWLDGLDMRFGAVYAEQGLIGRKALLQHTGYTPDEIEIQAVLHASWCNPAQELARLKDAMLAARPLAFVLGTGEYRGVFVLTELEAVTRQTDGYGAAISFEVRIRLREYVGDPAEPLPPGVVRDGMRIPIAAEEVAPAMPGLAGGPLDAIADASARGISAVAGVADAAASLATLASVVATSPASAPMMLPGVAEQLAQAAQALPVESYRALERIAAVSADAAQTASAMQSARALLDGARESLDDGIAGVSAAQWSAGTAVRALDGARGAMARIARVALLRQEDAWHT